VLGAAKFRVLALSATPGKDKQKINEVIENLMIQEVKAMVDSDPEIQKYVGERSLARSEATSCSNTRRGGLGPFEQPFLAK